MARERDASFDIVKGISILAVMVIHSTSHSSRKYTDEHSGGWWGLMLTNRLMSFAVPTFLLVSALLLARSLATQDKPNWLVFYKRRVVGAVWPFAVWTILYIAFRLYVQRSTGDIQLATHEWPLLGAIQGPELISSPGKWYNAFVNGRAYFHLYFMAILIKVVLLFPFVFQVRRIQISTITMICSCLLGQTFWHIVQAQYLHLRNPASSPGTYLGAILVGAWIGANWPQAKLDLQQLRWPLVLAALVTAASFMAQSAQALGGTKLNSMFYNISYGLFTTLAGLALLASAIPMPVNPLTRSLASVGKVSIVLYLVHPMLLYWLSGPRLTSTLASTGAGPIISFVLLFGTTWLFLKAVTLVRLDSVLFGQSFREKPFEKPA